jgi:hypothetical protein
MLMQGFFPAVMDQRVCMLRRKLLVLVAMAATTSALAGQELPTGRRVRLTLADSSTYAGRLDSAYGARVWLATGNAVPRAVELGKVSRIEVSRGKKPKWLLGAALGASAGFLTGLVLEPKNLDPEDEGWKTLYRAIGAGAGLLIGTGLSLVLAPERWEAVPSDRWAVPHASRNVHALRGWQLGLNLHH